MWIIIINYDNDKKTNISISEKRENIRGKKFQQRTVETRERKSMMPCSFGLMFSSVQFSSVTLSCSISKVKIIHNEFPLKKSITNFEKLNIAFNTYARIRNIEYVNIFIVISHKCHPLTRTNSYIR